MRRAVVSFADNYHYQAKLDRLIFSLKNNFSGDVVTFRKYDEIKCEPHQQIPFKFKPMAIKKAFDMGYDSVLWADSQVYAKSNIDKVFDYIEENEGMIFDNIGFSLGDYTNDKCLNYFSISRDDSWKIKMVNAKVFGVTKNSIWFEKYLSTANELYPGEWHNKFGSESDDMRCKGHRHDQSVLSCLAKVYNLKIIKSQDTFFANEDHRLVMPISDTVCLFAD